MSISFISGDVPSQAPKNQCGEYIAAVKLQKVSSALYPGFESSDSETQSILMVSELSNSLRMPPEQVERYMYDAFDFLSRDQIEFVLKGLRKAFIRLAKAAVNQEVVRRAREIVAEHTDEPEVANG